ncbi:MAG: ATP-dependent DNA helicase RecG [Clostridia bacterium]|nr:ATP-dependent DNA helicase RecG [Clostridia bacterium]
MNELMDRPIQFVKGVGEKRAELFHRLGVHTVRDLLHTYPARYEDWSQIVSIAEAPIGEPCCIRATALAKPQEHRIRKGLTLYKFTVSDGLSGMHITLFNTKYVAASIRAGEDYLFFGTVEQRFHRFEMSSPAIAPAQGGQQIRPIYRQTAGLNSAAVERTVKAALALFNGELEADALPEDIRRRHNLISRSDAIRAVHFPASHEALNAARKRLVFEELFVLQLGLLRLKGHNRSKTAVTIATDCSEEFKRLLPFTLTGAQSRALADCVRDMQTDRPMNRLIQGDVGSGKTAVAAGVCYSLIRNGWQAAMMAPTEILARQHYASFVKLFENTTVRVGLLVGSMTTAQKRRTVEALADGTLDLVVGTHALLSDNVHFASLGLVITDEQHRFGVGQRAALSSKGRDPHRLVMSATPIPRTLALMIYGDLDVSVLDELPPGRQPIATYAVGSDKRERVYNYIDRFLSEGRQGYIVCPLIEEDEEELPSDLMSAEEYYARLQSTVLGKYRIGLLHGRMKGAQKDEVMRAFAAHELDLLVSTTVIEVGVDVPNAVIMVLENAERFGLAQMHQLRGRVGRGQHASCCILISDGRSEETRQRLKVMTKTTDGFVIAEEDLKLRGPGDFFGNRQHGLPVLSIADLKGDLQVLHQAQEEALAVSRRDPSLSHPSLAPIRDMVARLFAAVGEDGLN